MSASKDRTQAMVFAALRVARDDAAGVFELLCGAIVTLAAMRPEGVDVLYGCVDVLDSARIELQLRAGNSAGNSSGGSHGTDG